MVVVEGRRVGGWRGGGVQFQARYEVECWMAICRIEGEKQRGREDAGSWRSIELQTVQSMGTKGLLIRSQVRLKGFICVREIRNFLQPG